MINKIGNINQIYQEKREKIEINKIRNEKEVTTDNTEIQRIKDNYEQLQANKIVNLERMNKFLEKYHLTKLH